MVLKEKEIFKLLKNIQININYKTMITHPLKKSKKGFFNYNKKKISQGKIYEVNKLLNRNGVFKEKLLKAIEEEEKLVFQPVILILKII